PPPTAPATPSLPAALPICGGHPLRRPQALVGAEPPHLGHHPLQGPHLSLGRVVPPLRLGHRPRRDHHRLAPGQRGPQLLGDEREDRKSTRLNSSHVKISYA